MRAKILLAAFTALLISSSLSLVAQETAPNGTVRCGSDEHMRQLYEQNPEFRERQQRLEELWATWQPPARKNSDEVLYRIPVVFHVIHDNGPENISESQIRSQIDVLNEDFQKLEGTPGDGPGANPQIEFYLAKIDPFGECANGITRHISPITYDAGSSYQLKQIVFWPGGYLNIYAVRSAGYTGNAPVLGYAATGTEVVVRAQNIGRTGAIDPPYNGGRTLTHEVGHWLGLRHPFLGGCLGSRLDNCRTEGDKVCDTPAESESDYNCYEPENSCEDFPTDHPDLPGLYMNYYDDACMDRFTEGQVERMHFTLEEELFFYWSEENLRRTGYYGCETSSREHTGRDALIGFNIFPNPASDILTVTFRNDAISDWTAEIFSSDGKIVARRALNAENGNVARDLDVSTLTAGVYTLAIIPARGGPAIFRRFAVH